jgi:hypothetical protein
MTVTSKAVPSVNYHPNLDKGPPTSPGSDINFIAAFDRLSARFGKTGKEFEIARKVRKVATRRGHAVRQIDRFEESLYWMLSAVTLIYLMLWIIRL